MRKIRSSCFVAVCMVVALLCPLRTTSSRASELKKLSLDNAAALGTTIVTDTKVKCEGDGSIRISTSWPTTICLGEV